ncbi:MAG: hypothetical protein ACK5NT_04015 [Pyrinomonadaceae bacterium]
MKNLTLVFILFSVFTAFSQTTSSEFKADGQVKSDKPTAYLEYVCQDKKKIYLRMFNNTIWAISVESDQLYYKTKKVVKLSNGKGYYTMPNDVEVSLLYSVDKFALPWEKVKVPKIAYPDSSFGNWIASNDSILFSVPIEYLRKDLMVLVRLNYEWEVTTKGVIVSGPEHRVLFRGVDLPNSPTVCPK